MPDFTDDFGMPGASTAGHKYNAYEPLVFRTISESAICMSTLTYARTFNSSELSRNLKPVIEAVESQPVLVTRRDGENLVLMTEHEADDRRDMFAIAAQIIAATTLKGGSLAERMATVSPLDVSARY
ncbi:type II toxin-antitoxin system Phd/YefM family antitoxin [Rothia nasimurium]|uniref:type II toxin-antitoxin system Phd/YefM family antitoxin n=1 Tax=Rothia nasimurium TaxID=85336 RepID=UPI001F3CC746|nr:type II toxin-antitoxin system Phd/YefM family antitoxin [Rothia nasimurium]